MQNAARLLNAVVEMGVLDDLKVSLDGVAASDKADAGVLKAIDKLTESLEVLKSKWLGVPDTDAFYFYLAIRCTEMILDEMADRLKNAERSGGGSKAAEDSLAVLAPMRDLLGAAGKLSITPSSIGAVLDCT